MRLGISVRDILHAPRPARRDHRNPYRLRPPPWSAPGHTRPASRPGPSTSAATPPRPSSPSSPPTPTRPAPSESDRHEYGLPTPISCSPSASDRSPPPRTAPQTAPSTPGISSGRVHRRRIDAHLIRPGLQHPPKILHRPNPAPDTIRNKHLFRHPRRILEHHLPIIRRSRNIQKHQLVRPLARIKRRPLHRVPRVAQVDELRALNHSAVLHVEAGNNA